MWAASEGEKKMFHGRMLSDPISISNPETKARGWTFPRMTPIDANFANKIIIRVIRVFRGLSL